MKILSQILIKKLNITVIQKFILFILFLENVFFAIIEKDILFLGEVRILVNKENTLSTSESASGEPGVLRIFSSLDGLFRWFSIDFEVKDVSCLKKSIIDCQLLAMNPTESSADRHRVVEGAAGIWVIFKASLNISLIFLLCGVLRISVGTKKKKNN